MAKERYRAGEIGKIARLTALILFFASFCGVRPVLGQSRPQLEYQVKAAFLFNFTKFINWPPDAFKSADAPFVIGIVGDDPFGAYLDELVKGEKSGTHPIVVERYSDISEVANCQMLFININPLLQQQIMAVTKNQNILTVSDADNFTSRGGDIEFFKRDNKIRIAINITAAKNSGLEISSKLLSIAKLNRF